MSDNKFAQGIYIEERNAKTPAFVIARLSLKRAEVIAWLQTLDDEYVKIDCMLSKGGKPYAKVNNYVSGQKKEAKPVEQSAPVEDGKTIEYPEEEIDPSSIPF